MKRLFEDPEQSAELRNDLVRSRAAGQDYPAADKLAQLRAALSDPARQPLGEGAKLQLGWRTLHPGWKLAALLAIGGAAALLTQPALRQVTREAQPSAASRGEVQTTARESSATGAPQQLAAAPAVEATQPAAEAAAASRPSTPPPNAASAVSSPSGDADEVPRPAAASTPSADPLELNGNVPQPAAASTLSGEVSGKSSRREIAQLVRIRALLEQDPAAAYRLAVRSEREFPAGVLSEERHALAIVALRKMGANEQAERKAREFFARYPQSPMRGTIEAALGQDPR